MPAKKSISGEIKKGTSSKKLSSTSAKSANASRSNGSSNKVPSSGVVRATSAKKRKQIEFDVAGPVLTSTKKRTERTTEVEDEADQEETTRKRVSAKKRLQQAQRDGGSDSDDDGLGLVDDDGDDSEDDLSDVADADSLSSGDDDDNPFVRARRDGTKLSYPVLRLRFLPAEFEEPQLFKFLNQFGATVLNCFCVRSKRTFQSLGIAYIQFDNPKVLPIVREECDGMLLGARTVRAKVISLHRAMPSKEAVTRRRLLGHSYRDQGRPIKQFLSPSRKNDVAMLIKATRSEIRNNHQLRKLGIEFSSHAFSEQLASLPKVAILPKKQPVVDALLSLARQQQGTSAEDENHSSEITHKLLRQALGRPTGRHRANGSKKAPQRKSGTPTPSRQAKKSKAPVMKKKVRRSLRKKKTPVVSTTSATAEKDTSSIQKRKASAKKSSKK